MTWTLIIILSQFDGFHGARALSSSTVSGFSTREACEAEAARVRDEIVMKFENRTVGVRSTCVGVK